VASRAALVIPAQLIRAAGQLARLTGAREHHAALVALEERATLDDVLELLDDLVDAVDRARPRPPPVEEPGAPRGVGRPHAPHHAEVVRLVQAGGRDRAVADELGISREAVRSIRRAEGIAAAPWTPPPATWQERLRELHRQGLTTAAMVEATGWSTRTVQQRLFLLKLKAHRPRRQVRGDDAK
jgi:hypothetical protein